MRKLTKVGRKDRESSCQYLVEFVGQKGEFGRSYARLLAIVCVISGEFWREHFLNECCGSSVPFEITMVVRELGEGMQFVFSRYAHQTRLVSS